MVTDDRWYWHVRGVWPDGTESILVMVAKSEEEIRKVWQHYEILSITRGAPAQRRRTVEA